jgi:hypothetical protein
MRQEMRAQPRVAVTRRASLSAGDTYWIPCMIMDMSDKGLMLVCNKKVPVGQLLQFRCELFPEKSLECKIQVKHVSDACMGAKIVEIDPQGSNLVQSYLQEQYSHALRPH